MFFFSKNPLIYFNKVFWRILCWRHLNLLTFRIVKLLNFKILLMSKLISVFVLCFFIWSCNSEETPQINKGTITIAIDEAVKPIIDAQIATYKIHYPEATIKSIVMPENKAIYELFRDSITILAGTRGLNKEEVAIMTARGISYQPARMAIDAVALVVNSNSDVSKISIPELKKLFNTKGSKLIFDGGNSANLNLISEKIGLDSIPSNTVFTANGNLEVLDIVRKTPGSIGFIGFNWISDDDDPRSAKRLQGLKLVSIEKPNTGVYFDLSRKNLKDRNYAFERFIYIHTFSKVWGIENGFIRHCCSKIGQLVTEKMGLVPFYLIPKEFLLNNKAKNVNPVR
jgi:phosphate transport system substrate-binding protein